MGALPPPDRYARPPELREIAATALLVEGLLEKLDGPPLKAGAKAADTVAFEARSLRTALSPELMAFLRERLDIGELGSREEIEALATSLRSTGL